MNRQPDRSSFFCTAFSRAALHGRPLRAGAGKATRRQTAGSSNPGGLLVRGGCGVLAAPRLIALSLTFALIVVLTTPMTAQAADHPANVTVTAGDQEVFLAWDDPSDDTIDAYQVSVTDSVAGRAWVTIPDSDDKMTSHTVTGLANDTEHHIRLREARLNATDQLVGGVTTGDMAVTLVAASAKTPTGLEATPGNSQVTLSWDNPTDTGVTQYQYSTDFGANWTVAANLDNDDDTSVVVTTLTNATGYTFLVRSVESGSAVDPAISVSSTPVGAPTGLVATPSNGQVTLTWTDPANVSITGYEVSVDDGVTWSDIAASGATTTSHTVTGLTNGTAYTFKVRAVVTDSNDDPVDGAESAAAATTPVGAPTGLSATPGDGQVTLTWTDPENAAITKYQISSDGVTWSDIAASGASTTSHTVTGLTNGTAYTFGVRAVVTDSSSSDVAGAGRNARATPGLDAPTDLKATPGDGQVTLEWTDPSDTRITGYEVSVDDGVTWTAIEGSGATTTSHTVTGLTNGTAYPFAVRAVETDNEVTVPGAGSTVVTATPVGAPTGLEATPGDGEVTLTWTDPSNAAITGYQVSDDDGVNWTTIANSDETTVEHIVTALTDGTALVNGTAYTFTVWAVVTDSEGSPVNGAGSAVTATPVWDAPTGLSAAPGDGQVMLTWTDPENPGLTGYEVSVDDGAWSAITPSNATTTSHVVTGLVNGTEYTFAVRAVNGAGSTVSATPLVAAPANPVAAPGDGQVTLEWTDPDNDAIAGYQVSVTTSADTRDWMDISSDASTASSLLTGLVSGTEYTIAVRAVNGAASDAVSFTPSLGEPQGSVTTTGDGEVTLEWTDPENPAIAGYEVSVDDGVTWTAIEGSGAETTSHTVTGLVNGTEYTIAVRAMTVSFVSLASDGVSATPSVAAPPVAAPTGLVAAPGDGEVTLEWTDPENPAIAGYQVSVDDGVTWTAIEDSGATTMSHTVTGLVNGTEYTFAVRAVNGAASDGVSATPSVAVPPVAAPTGLVATPGDGEVTLTWDDPDDAAITGYQLRVNDGAWRVSFGDATTTSRTVISLVNGTGYDFAVRAVNGIASDTVTAIPTLFDDVPSGLWYSEAVAWAGREGITTGVSERVFDPHGPLDRAMLVTMVWRAAGSPKVGGSVPFTDVDLDAYYGDALRYAYANGIVVGTTGTTFEPHTTTSRAQVVTVLWRWVGSPPPVGSGGFVDVPAGRYFSLAAQWALDKGVTVGVGSGEFGPDLGAERAQFVTMLNRLLV